MPLVVGQETLAQIRLRARRRADRLVAGAPALAVPDPYADNFVTTPELNGYVNTGYKELYNMQVTAFGNDYFVAEYLFTTDGTNEKFALPKDMLKFRGIDWRQAPGSNSGNVALKPFNFAQRNQNNGGRGAWGSGGFGPPASYRIDGETVWLKPAPGGMELIVYYVPRPPALEDVGTVTLSGCKAGDTLTVDGVVFACVASGATGTQFNVGASDTATAVNLAAVINASSLGGLAGILSASAEGAVVSVALMAPASITWSASNTDLVLCPSTVGGALGSTITWTNVMTGYSGWEEYLVICAAIAMLDKEGSDSSALRADKAAKVQEIKVTCDNRDIGAPATVVDVYATQGGPFGFGW